MDRLKIIDYANSVINGQWHPASEKSFAIIKEYLEEKIPNKADSIYQAYIKLPDELKVKCVESVLKHYENTLHINTIKNIVKTPIGDQYIIIRYLEK